MQISRRQLMVGAGAFSASGLLPLSAESAVREPFLKEGDLVHSIVWHIWDHPLNPGPFGTTRVESVGAWDGIGYPIVLAGPPLPFLENVRVLGFYDHEWSSLREEVPDWYDDPGHEPFPNIHSYVRWRRFGESPWVMREIMEINRTSGSSPLGRIMRKLAVEKILVRNGAEVPWLRA